MKNYRNFMFILLFIFFQYSKSQNFTSLSKESMEYDGILGIGWGVFAIIICIIIGILCCIFGLSTLYPGIFISIGFCMPISMFLFMAFTPTFQPGNLNLKDNPAKNYYIIARWLFFTVMLIGVFVIFIPLCHLWSKMIIPQRVDSRAQREYYEKYEKLLEQEKLKSEKEKEIKKTQTMKLEKPEAKEEILLPIKNNQLDIEMADVQNRITDKFDVEDIHEGGENINTYQDQKKKKFLMGLRRKKDENSNENKEN